MPKAQRYGALRLVGVLVEITEIRNLHRRSPPAFVVLSARHQGGQRKTDQGDAGEFHAGERSVRMGRQGQWNVASKFSGRASGRQRKTSDAVLPHRATIIR